MIVVLCTALSAAGFFLSLGLGEQWWLAWLAPVPVLWLAFGDGKAWQSFLAGWVAFALGATNLLPAYAGLLPPQVLLLAILAPSLFFLLSVFSGRRVAGALGAI